MHGMDLEPPDQAEQVLWVGPLRHAGVSRSEFKQRCANRSASLSC